MERKKKRPAAVCPVQDVPVPPLQDDRPQDVVQHPDRPVNLDDTIIFDRWL